MPRRAILNADLRPLGDERQGILIEGDRIEAVIPMADLESIPLTGVEFMDAAGATVLPGIDDSHLHGYEYGRSLTAHDLRDCRSLAEFQHRLRDARPEANGWIRGIGWDAALIPGSGPDGLLCAADVDAVHPDVPVLLSDVTGHQALCNTTALRAAGVSGGTADPIGGRFLRDEGGAPTGLLLESAVGMLNDAMPRLSIAEQRAAILAAQQALLSQGVTAFTDPGLGPGARTLIDGTGDLNAVEAYRQLDVEGALRMRVNLMLLFGGLGGTRASDVADGLDAWGPPRRQGPHTHLDIAQVKVFADGVPRSRTAWLSEPYDDCTCGHLQVAGDTDDARVAELHAIIAAAISRGWQVGAHSIGDRAIGAYVDALEAAGAAADDRHYVIHGDLVTDADLGRMHRLGMILNSNPSIRWMVGRTVSPILGDRRNVERQPLRRAVDLGVAVASSSDAPIMAPDWRLIAATAMTRALRTDPGYTDDQRLTAREAMTSLTAVGAWQSHAEGWRGAIAPGLAADLVVLDGAVDWAEPWQLTDRSVGMTMVGGVVVHGNAA